VVIFCDFQADTGVSHGDLLAPGLLLFTRDEDAVTILVMLVAAVFGILLFVTVGDLVMSDRKNSAKLACFIQLRDIDAVEQTWALKNQNTTNDTPQWEDVLGYFYRPEQPQCPARGTYTLARIGEPPTCSIPEHTIYYRQHRPPSWIPGQTNAPAQSVSK
jgi:hypothetical protein